MRIKNISILLIFVALLMPHLLRAQGSSQVTLGEATYVSNTFPFCNYFRGSWSQSLYAPWEIQQSGYITEVAYNCAYADTMTFDDLRIYMGVTYDTVLEDGSDLLSMSALALVYSSSNVLMGMHTGWHSFALQSPFYYDATAGAHLVIVVAKYAPDWNYDLQWYYDETDYGRTLYRQCDDEDRSCAQFPGPESWADRTHGRPQTRLTISASADNFCALPSAVAVTRCEAHSATVAWTPAEGSSQWELSYGPVGFHPDSSGTDITHAGPLTTPSFELVSLAANSNYDLYVRTVCSPSLKSAWRSTRFHTPCDPLASFPYEEDFESAGSDGLPDCWEKRMGTLGNFGVRGWAGRRNDNGLAFASEWSDSLQMVTLPPMDRIDTLRISFFAFARNGGRLQVGVMEDSTFVLVEEVSALLGNGEYDAEPIEVDFSNYHGAGRRIALRALFAEGYGEVGLDDILVEGSSSHTHRTSFTVTVADFDNTLGNAYAYTLDPYNEAYIGQTITADSGSTLFIRVYCYDAQLLLDSATLNGVPFLTPRHFVDTTVVVTVTGPIVIRVAFAASLPDLHVVALSHSPLRAGEDATISWTVRNDGHTATPDGVTWYDRLWISMECRVATEDDNPAFLGEFPNVRVLNPGESYTQTQTVHIPHDVDGDKYLFAISDAHDCYSILWEDSILAPVPCPAAAGHFLSAMSAHCSGEHCCNSAGTHVVEELELYRGSACHDNFFYDTVHIQPGPNPDLQVVGLVHPTTLYSGSHIEAFVSVTNAGDRSSSYRYDQLYVSTSPVFDSAAVYIGDAFHTIPAVTGSINGEAVWGRVPMYGMLSLMPNESCIDSFDCVLPDEVYGTAYFYVVLDATNASYEHAGEDNNVFRSDPVLILLSPYPDLVATHLSAPDQISTADTFALGYTLLNQGLGSCSIYPRTDRFFLTPADGDPIEIGALEGNYWAGELDPADSINYVRHLLLPDHLDSGSYSLTVAVDDEADVFEYLYDDNNVALLPHPIHVVKPDLQVSQLLTEDTLLLGASNRIAYTLENRGEGLVNHISRTDQVFLARNADGSGICCYAHYPRTLYLPAGRSLTEEVLFAPDRLLPEGRYYLIVETNTYGDIHESDLQNNFSAPVSVYLKREILPDLQLSSLSASGPLQAGSAVQVEWNLHNTGSAPLNHADLSFAVALTNGSDTARCSILSCSPSLGDLSLAPQTSRHFECTLFLSPAANASYNQLLVEADPRNEIRESDDSNNRAILPVSVSPYLFDLALQSLTATAAGSTGDSLSLSWTVRNQGSLPNASTPLYLMRDGSTTDASQYVDPTDPTHSLWALWRDAVYLSLDTQWDTNDLLLGHAYNYNYPAPNSLYSATTRVQLPYRLWGSFYLLVRTDDLANTFDHDRSNNLASSPIEIALGAMPDLRVTQLSFRRDNVESGQSYKLYYTVQNQGASATPQSAWVDHFFLDTSGVRQLVAYRHHTGALLPGDSYSDSVDISIPRLPIGTYTFSATTDATDLLFEHDGEYNNTLSMELYVTLPLPSDLIPGTPSCPSSVLLDGQGFSVTYSLRNAGPNYAYGKVKELVYLSEDDQWSSDDYLFSTQTPTISIASGAASSMTAFASSPAVTPGYYYLIVRSNALNALNESSYSNNTVVSRNRVCIDYPSLRIGTPYAEAPVRRADRYFRIDVSPEQVGQTLRCQVSGVRLQELFLSHNTSPSPTRYDYYTSTPTSTSTSAPVPQYELIVPSLKAGTYYLLLRMGDVRSRDSLHILASIVDFDVVSIDAASGANSGSLTARIRGAKFDTVMDFRLEQNGHYIPATKIHLLNSSDAYTTFDLTGASPGQYDVVAELEGGVVVTKPGAFTIEEGLPAHLNARVEGPSTVRIGVVFQAAVEYSNTGKTDVPISGLMVVSRNGHPIAFTTDKLSEGATRLFVPIGEQNGNPDVVRPGQTGTRTLFVYPNSGAEVILDLYTVKAQ